MLIGIGTDILKISNIEKIVSDISDPFIQKRNFCLLKADRYQNTVLQQDLQEKKLFLKHYQQTVISFC